MSLEVHNSDDPNKALEAWQDIFMDTLNEHAPLKEKRVKMKFQPDWFNEEINDAIKKRNRAKQSEPHLYRQYRNAVTSLIRSAN